MDKFEKLAKLVEDEAFIEELGNQEDINTVQSMLAAKGVELTIEEIEAWGEQIRKANAEGELDADALDNVAGGTVVWGPWRPFPLPLPRPRPGRWPRVW